MRGTYIRGPTSGGLYLGGLYSEVCNRGLTSEGFISGGLVAGTYIQWNISGGIYSVAYIRGLIFHTGIFKDSTCFMRAEQTREFVANK